MIKKLILSSNFLFWTLFHVLLGAASSISPYALIIWFYLVVISSFFVVLRLKSYFPFLVLISYLISFELLARMSQTSPFIPYELGKYLLFFMLLVGIIKFGVRNKLGFVLVLLLLPSVFFDLSGEVDKGAIVFNLLGPLNVGLVVCFFYGRKLERSKFIKLLRISILPLVSVLASTIFKTPSYTDLEFTLGANSAVSGGGGSNQISTLLGVGMFLSFIFLINRWNLTGKRYLDFLLFFLFAFQGLLTFSRGGMIGGILGILIVIFFILVSNSAVKRRYNLPRLAKIFVMAVILMLFTFQVANNLSGGLLMLRYLGETEGTLAGTKEKTLDSFTTGRVTIFTDDLELWYDNFVFGVGAGASSYLREGSQFYLTHVELSRLLSEHGVLGLVYFLILLYFLIKLTFSKKPPMEKGILLAFFIIALYTTFHAAMRTYLTPLFIGLSLLNLQLSSTTKKPAKKGTQAPQVKRLEPLFK
ncbi:O-antigen ligase family protein [Algoriphagus sp.]|uniref:O-antigen ligase family protein n=1 Tax=Algoriphagus sp. TaxID=1872435 RepID=UPI0032969F35